MSRIIAGALAFALWGSPVWAQTHTDANGTVIPGVALIPSRPAGAYAGATVGASDMTIIAAGSAVTFIEIWNLSPSATVCLNFGAPATIAGTQCAAGEVPMGPTSYWVHVFVVPQDAIHAIASAASTPMTVGAK